MAFYLSLSLIFFSTLLSASNTYILSYRAQIKDAVVISESFYLSPSMKPIKAHTDKRLKLENIPPNDLNKILEKNREKVLLFFMQHGAHTRSHEEIINHTSSSRISLTIPPTYITVDFKNDYAIITRLILE